MLPNVLRRVGYALLVILLVTFTTSVLMSLAPGSIAEIILGEGATPESIAALNESLGLDRPVIVQYLDWLLHALQGDLGVSPITHIPVTEAILQRLPVTLELAVLALLISLIIADSARGDLGSASRPSRSIAASTRSPRSSLRSPRSSPAPCSSTSSP